MDDAIFFCWIWLKNMEKGFDIPFHSWSSNIKVGFCKQGGIVLQVTFCVGMFTLIQTDGGLILALSLYQDSIGLDIVWKQCIYISTTCTNLIIIIHINFADKKKLIVPTCQLKLTSKHLFNWRPIINFQFIKSLQGTWKKLQVSI